QYPVDHSVCGASAYAVETEAGWVCYTGDLRLHGSTAFSTRAFAEQVASLKPRVLICEGTRITDKARVTEDEVYIKALEAVKQSSGLVLADFGARNIERLLIFNRIAGETSRQLIVMPRDAYLLDKLSPVMDAVPSIEDCKDLLIYADPKARLDTWEREIREKLSSHLVDAETIRKNQGDYILCFSFWDLNDMVDLSPDNGVYIYSSSEVFDEEGGIDMKRLHNWADHFHLKKVGLPVPTVGTNDPDDWEIPPEQQGLHASGHAGGPELIEMIKLISPEILLPVHTLHKEVFARELEGTGIEVRFPSPGKTIQV
ncbi:MBL fold metallo-hydrolase RNA specificity domain-containing protein, partial [Chloroflexota bacterium]